MFHVPEKYRLTTGTLASDSSYGNNGAFFIEKKLAQINWTRNYVLIASDDEGWEHVSVHVEILGKSITPDWKDMCFIKDMFWDEDDCVVQYHPSKDQYVNNHPNVLHLWRPTELILPRPNPLMVGIK